METMIGVGEMQNTGVSLVVFRHLVLIPEHQC